MDEPIIVPVGKVRVTGAAQREFDNWAIIQMFDQLRSDYERQLMDQIASESAPPIGPDDGDPY